MGNRGRTNAVAWQTHTVFQTSTHLRTLHDHQSVHTHTHTNTHTHTSYSGSAHCVVIVMYILIKYFNLQIFHKQPQVSAKRTQHMRDVALSKHWDGTDEPRRRTRIRVRARWRCGRGGGRYWVPPFPHKDTHIDYTHITYVPAKAPSYLSHAKS